MVRTLGFYCKGGVGSIPVGELRFHLLRCSAKKKKVDFSPFRIFFKSQLRQIIWGWVDQKTKLFGCLSSLSLRCNGDSLAGTSRCFTGDRGKGGGRSKKILRAPNLRQPDIF